MVYRGFISCSSAGCVNCFFRDRSRGVRRRIEEKFHMNRDLLFKVIDILHEQIYI